MLINIDTQRQVVVQRCRNDESLTSPLYYWTSVEFAVYKVRCLSLDKYFINLQLTAPGQANDKTESHN